MLQSEGIASTVTSQKNSVQLDGLRPDARYVVQVRALTLHGLWVHRDLRHRPHLAKAQLTTLTQDTSMVYSGWPVATVLTWPPTPRGPGRSAPTPPILCSCLLLCLYAHSGSRFWGPGVTLSLHYVSKPDQLDPRMKEGLYHQRIF